MFPRIQFRSCKGAQALQLASSVRGSLRIVCNACLSTCYRLRLVPRQLVLHQRSSRFLAIPVSTAPLHGVLFTHKFKIPFHLNNMKGFPSFILLSFSLARRLGLLEISPCLSETSIRLLVDQMIK